MIDIDIKIDTHTVLRVLSVDVDKMRDDIIEDIAKEAVLSRLRQYPGQMRKRQPFVSVKQRRFFFAALRDGKITVPYRRSGELASKWQLSSNNGGVGIISSGKVYAKFVMGEKDEQSKYHQGNWFTVNKVADESEADAALVATATLIEAYRKAGA